MQAYELGQLVSLGGKPCEVVAVDLHLVTGAYVYTLQERQGYAGYLYKILAGTLFALDGQLYQANYFLVFSPEVISK